MMNDKPALTSVKVHEIIQNRWSPRAFDADRGVSDAHLAALLEAARWAPSCFNEQPWRYVIWVKSKDEAGWRKALSILSEKNRQWAKNAPVLILSAAKHHFSHNGKSNRWAMYDTGAASLSLCLQATALGLAVHQMGGFDAMKSRELFHIPEEYLPMSMMAVGYQADAEILDNQFIQAELADRSRSPLSEQFYLGQWDNGFAQ